MINTIHLVIRAIQQILEFYDLKRASVRLTMPTHHLLAILNLNHHSKNQFIPLIPLCDIANSKVMGPGWSHPFWNTPTPIFF